MPESTEHRPAVALLDADPDLGAALAAEELQAARRRALAQVIEVLPPRWDPAEICERAEDGWLGLFVLQGVLIRRVNVGRRAAGELFGTGDLLRPWDADADYQPLPISVDWLVLRETRLAVLDTSFVVRTAPWPSINGRIVSRIAQRARYLGLSQSVTHLPRADARLLILFWLLAERWGKVSPDGVYVTLPLTHEVLSTLVGAHRPTVTLALQRLARDGLLVREHSDRWLLTNAAVTALEDPDSLGLSAGIGAAPAEGDPPPGRPRAPGTDEPQPA